MSSITFKIIPSTTELEDIVVCFRIAEYAGRDSVSVNICPNGLPGMVFQAGCVEAISTSDGTVADVPKLFLYGQVTEPSSMHFRPGPYRTVQVLFKPDALRLLLADASTLTDNFLPAMDFGAGWLENELAAAEDEQAVVQILSEFLSSLAKRPVAEQDTLVAQAIRLIDERHEAISVAEIIRTLDISERQFQKRFNRAVGITPQLYIRTRRFNKAMKLMDSGQYDRLSDIAFALDFHDQSHFIRDIKAFSGQTPKGITQKVDEFYHDQVGTSFI